MKDTESSIKAQFIKYTKNNLPGYLNNSLVLNIIRKIMCFDDVLKMEEEYKLITNFDFVNKIILSVGLSVEYKNVENIPSKGRLLVVANHPLGAADWLVLLQCLNTARRDIKVVINKDVYVLIKNLRDLFIPVDTYATFNDAAKHQIEESLKREEAVIIFPAGGISIPTIKGIRDRKWKNGAVLFSRENATDILPVFISGRSSFEFIGCPKRYRRFLLVRNLLHPPSQKINVVVGDLISYQELFKDDNLTRLSLQLSTLVYKLGKTI